MPFFKSFIPVKPQQWFVVIALVFGGFFAAITPPYLGGDEFFHFTRAYQIAEGQFIPEKTVQGTGGQIPDSVVQSYGYINNNHSRLADIKAAIVHFPLNRDARTFVSFPNTAVGNPLMYAPQAMAIRVGLWFDAPPVILMQLARFANLAFYIVAMYVAIRLLPYGKLAAMAIALMPANIVAASSGSADTFTIVAMGMFIATFLHMRARVLPLGLWGRIGLLGLVIAVSLAKMPLQVMLLLGFLIPVRALGGTRRQWFTFLALAALLAVVACGAWIMVIQATITPYGPPGVSPVEQLDFMLGNPVHFITAAIQTYLFLVTWQAYSFAIVPPPDTFPILATIAYSIFLARFFPVGAGKQVLGPWQKWFAATLGLVFVLGVAALLYLSWSPVGSSAVHGIHPRYLAPLLFLLIPICAVAYARKPSGFSKAMAFALPVCFLVLATFLLLQGYYL